MLNLVTNTPSILPINGAGKKGLTIAGRELAVHFVDDYARSLANFSHN